MIEERDPLREAIEREVLLYCSCPGTCCCAATVNDVHAAVAPLLAAAREEGRREGLSEAASIVEDLSVRADDEDPLTEAETGILYFAGYRLRKVVEALLDAPREETRKP